MHVFLAERSPPIDGPVAAKVRRDFCAFVVQRAGKAERHRDVEADLIERSRQAIAQSFAVLAKVPHQAGWGFPAEAPEGSFERHEAISDRASPWLDLFADGAGDRFFFDVDDGERKRRDEVGMVLPGPGDIPRETKAVLFDLAYAEIPAGRPRMFTAKVRDALGAVIYRGSMTMRPLPND